MVRGKKKKNSQFLKESLNHNSLTTQPSWETHSPASDSLSNALGALSNSGESTWSAAAPSTTPSLDAGGAGSPLPPLSTSTHHSSLFAWCQLMCRNSTGASVTELETLKIQLFVLLSCFYKMPKCSVEYAVFWTLRYCKISKCKGGKKKRHLKIDCKILKLFIVATEAGRKDHYTHGSSIPTYLCNTREPKQTY